MCGSLCEKCVLLLLIVLFFRIGKGGVFKSIHGVGAVMTNMVLGSGLPQSAMGMPADGANQGKGSQDKKEDKLVMETKLKIIQILQVRLHVSYL